jgi:hypothetical protein
MTDQTKTHDATRSVDVINNKPLNPAPRSPLLSKREMAAVLRKSTRTLDTWMRLGLIPHLKVSRTVLFDLEDVLAHLRRHHRVGPSE